MSAETKLFKEQELQLQKLFNYLKKERCYNDCRGLSKFIAMGYEIDSKKHIEVRPSILVAENCNLLPDLTQYHPFPIMSEWKGMPRDKQKAQYSYLDHARSIINGNKTEWMLCWAGYDGRPGPFQVCGQFGQKDSSLVLCRSCRRGHPWPIGEQAKCAWCGENENIVVQPEYWYLSQHLIGIQDANKILTFSSLEFICYILDRQNILQEHYDLSEEVFHLDSHWSTDGKSKFVFEKRMEHEYYFKKCLPKPKQKSIIKKISTDKTERDTIKSKIEKTKGKMMPSSPLKIKNATITEVKYRSGIKKRFVQGELHLDSLDDINIATYQRGKHSKEEVSSIAEAYLDGTRIQTIELSTRQAKLKKENGILLIDGITSVVDGYGRIDGAKEAHKKDPDAEFPVFVTIELDTSWHVEKDDYLNFNTKRRRVSSSETIRVLSYDYPAMRSLIKLTTEDKTFPFYNRVSWTDQPPHKHMTGALTFAKMITALHGFMGVSSANSSEEVCKAIQSLWDRLGEKAFMHNVREFSKMLHDAYGLSGEYGAGTPGTYDYQKKIPYGRKLAHAKGGFLWALATVFADNFGHQYLWNELELKIAKGPITKKLKTMKAELAKPEVLMLVSAGGASRLDLVKKITQWINSGKEDENKLNLNAKRLAGLKDTYEDHKTEIVDTSTDEDVIVEQLIEDPVDIPDLIDIMKKMKE